MKRILRTLRNSQQGSAMVEFVVVGSTLSLIGLGLLQYSLLFNAKNLVNHAAYMAARAGSMGNADLAKVESAYTQALVPLYGGGSDVAQIAQALVRAKCDLTTGSPECTNTTPLVTMRIELINPSADSFKDHNNADIASKYGVSHAIPNAGQQFKDANAVGSDSKQNIQDANLLKIRIVHGYAANVLIVRELLRPYFKAMQDSATDSFYANLYAQQRFPIVTEITQQMQSDALEPRSFVRYAGDSTPPNPPPPPSEPPTSPTPKPPGSSPGTGQTSSLLTCHVAGTNDERILLPGDVNFDTDKSTLTDQGKSVLDQWIAQAPKGSYDAIEINGYTDDVGTDAYNLDLSQRRANTVKQYLLDHGLTSKPITAIGNGKANPVCNDSPMTALCRAKNRRVTITLKNFVPG